MNFENISEFGFATGNGTNMPVTYLSHMKKCRELVRESSHIFTIKIVHHIK